MKRERILQRLQGLPGWLPERPPRSIIRTYSFEDPKEALHFASEIAELGELQDHYPESVLIKSNRMEVRLFTPEAKGLTELDFDLAAQIERNRSNFLKDRLTDSGLIFHQPPNL